MFSWRARRQLAGIGVLAVIFGGLGTMLVIRFLPAPSCSDNKKNQRELNVDCGGPCAPCELRNPKPILIFWARAAATRENSYDAAAQIKNGNEILGTSALEYEFTLFDELGPVARKTGTTFLLPQETVTLVEVGLETTREPIRVEFRILNLEWQVKEDQGPSLVVEKRDYRVEESAGKRQSVIETSIFNGSPFDFREGEALFAVLDKEGNLLAANRVRMEEIRANSRKNVKSIWPEEIRGEVDRIEIKARVNIFDPNIILKPE